MDLGTKHLLSFDCGVSTGIALFEYSDTEPATLAAAWQFTGGVVALTEWVTSNYDWEDFPPWVFFPDNPEAGFRGIEGRDVTVIAEKFTPRQGAGFSLTTASVEPLRCEGALVALGVMPDYHVGGKNPQWQQPSQLYWAGGKTLAEKKKRLHGWLKDSGEFYVTGKQVGAPDADDARSAISHGLVWFRKNRHSPTLQRWFGGKR